MNHERAPGGDGSAPVDAGVAAPAAPPSGGDGLGATITRNAAFAVTGRLVFLFAWAAITPYMLRVLGEDRFAIWALFFALSGYFATFDLGLSQALIKFVAQHTAAGDARALRGVITIATLVYAVLTAPVVLALAVSQGPILALIHTPAALRIEAGQALLSMAIVLGLNNIVNVMTSVLTGRQRLDVVNRIQLVATVIQIGGALAVLSKGFGLLGLIAAYGLGVLVTGILSWRSMRTIAPDVVVDFSAIERSLFRDMFQFSAALQITLLGTFFQFQLDKFLLAHFATLQFVARFELANRLSLAAWAVPFLILPPLVPAASHLASQDDPERVLRLYHRASRYLLAISIPLAAFGISLAPHLVGAWLGTGYPEVAAITAVMVGFLLVVTSTGVGTAITRGIGRPWIEARYHMVGIATHLTLSLVLIPRFGLVGALWSLGISGIIATVYFLLQFHARLGVRTGRWLAENTGTPLLASLVASVPAVLLTGAWLRPPDGRMHSLMAIGVGGTLFAAIVSGFYLATRFIMPAEVRELVHGLRRAPAEGPQS